MGAQEEEGSQATGWTPKLTSSWCQAACSGCSGQGRRMPRALGEQPRVSLGAGGSCLLRGCRVWLPTEGQRRLLWPMGPVLGSANP